MNTYKHPAMLYCYTGWKCPNYSAPILSHFSHFALFPWYFTTSIKSCMFASTSHSPGLKFALSYFLTPHPRKRSTRDLEEIKGKPSHIAPRLGKDIQWSYKQKISEGRTDCLGLLEHLKVILIFQRKVDFPQPFLSWIFLVLWMLAGATNEGNHFSHCASLAEASFSHGWHFSEWRSNARSAWCGTMWPQSTRAGI